MLIFERLVADLRDIWSTVGAVEERMHAALPLLERVVRDPAMRDASRRWPSTEPRKNLLFYEDVEYGFALNGVVRSPRYRGGIHDHAHAWVLYGIVDGSESLERFERIDDGSRPGYAELVATSVTLGLPGRVDLVPAHAIHAEQGGDTRSAALILRSERVAGRVLQNAYDADRRSVEAREGPIQIPYALSAPPLRP